MKTNQQYHVFCSWLGSGGIHVTDKVFFFFPLEGQSFSIILLPHDHPFVALALMLTPRAT